MQQLCGNPETCTATEHVSRLRVVAPWSHCVCDYKFCECPWPSPVGMALTFDVWHSKCQGGDGNAYLFRAVCDVYPCTTRDPVEVGRILHDRSPEVAAWFDFWGRQEGVRIMWEEYDSSDEPVRVCPCTA